jgi:1-acyl-sn-glycerol-3-phosphate acyltransferase
MRFLIGPWCRWYFGLRALPAPEVQGPLLVVANHTTDLDAIFVALSFPRHMYYVASEHIFRKPLLRRLFAYYLDPIAKRKGGADVSTSMQMLRRLKKGMNVMLFAEGNKSFHGETCPVHPATGALVRASGATLVTVRLSGGYFSSPRWAHTLRRGRVTCAPVATYAPQVLAAMSDAEVNALIRRDIDEDAYARQQEHPVAFRGRRLAEGIENALYLCPRCGGFGTVHGTGNRIACVCGLAATYEKTGFLTGENAPFETLAAWGDWQRGALAERLAACGDAPLVQNGGQAIVRILPDHATQAVADGTLTLGRTGLACGGFHLPLADVLGLEIYGRNTIVFSDANGARYQVKTAAERSGLAYFEAYALLRAERG